VPVAGSAPVGPFVKYVEAQLPNLVGLGVDFAFADLSYANLSGADLTAADLEYSTLDGANLSGASLRRAQMTGAHFCNTTMPDGSTNNANCP
jgi:uncharacterized protein YjbI with pentapeptide repeats